MAVKSNFASGDVLTASDVNTYLTDGGLVYITQTLVSSGSATSVSFNNVFSSTYDNYRIVIDGFQPSTAGRGLYMRMRVGGVDATAADGQFAYRGLYTDGTSADANGASQTYMNTGVYNSLNSVALNSSVIDICNPFKTERTFANVNSILFNSAYGTRNGMMAWTAVTSYDGFTLYLNSTGNITTLRIRVYGYRNA